MTSKRKNENEENDLTSKYSKLVDQVSEETFEELNQQTLKKLVLSFEKKYNANEQMRLKYPDQPEKFMDSEIELDEEIKKLQIVATAPELYPSFVKLGAITSLGSLLMHENTDIVIDTIDIFQELTAQETPTEDESLALTNSIYENGILEVLVQTFNKLDCNNPDEQQATHNILNIFENLLEVKPVETALILVEKSEIFKYILKFISTKSTPLPIKLYCCEILSIILQENEQGRLLFGRLEGIEKLLVVISAYKKKSPESLEENEMVENIISSLCSCLFNNKKNKDLFIKSEGIELMLLFIKNKTTLRSSSLKVLNYATSSHVDCCKRFVDQLGLKTLFSSFMKKVKSKHNKKVYNESEDEENGKDAHNRVVSKFTENQCEKIDRCFELMEKYLKRLASVEEKMKQEADDNEEDIDEDELLLKKIDAGLLKLQLIDLIIAILYNSDNKDLKTKINETMNQKKISKKSILNVLNEYRESLDQTFDEGKTQFVYIGRVIDGFEK